MRERLGTRLEIDEIILKMKKAEPIFCNLAYKNSELLFYFPFLLRVLNASFSDVFLRKIIIYTIAGFQCHAIQNRFKKKIKTVQ